MLTNMGLRAVFHGEAAAISEEGGVRAGGGAPRRELIRRWERPRWRRGLSLVCVASPESGRRGQIDQAGGNFTHFAPSLLLFTQASMKAMPARPSSIVGKSYPFFGAWRPATRSAIAVAAAR
jgi:hypothetical protein